MKKDKDSVINSSNSFQNAYHEYHPFVSTLLMGLLRPSHVIMV
jgi:hypothetical protein